MRRRRPIQQESVRREGQSVCFLLVSKEFRVNFYDSRQCVDRLDDQHRWLQCIIQSGSEVLFFLYCRQVAPDQQVRNFFKVIMAEEVVDRKLSVMDGAFDAVSDGS